AEERLPARLSWTSLSNGRLCIALRNIANSSLVGATRRSTDAADVKSVWFRWARLPCLRKLLCFGDLGGRHLDRDLIPDVDHIVLVCSNRIPRSGQGPPQVSLDIILRHALAVVI